MEQLSVSLRAARILHLVPNMEMFRCQCQPGAEVLEYEGIRGRDYRLMAEDFIMQQQLRPEKEKECFHCSLSFYPGEVLSNELMVKIAKEYLEKLGIKKHSICNNQTL